MTVTGPPPRYSFGICISDPHRVQRARLPAYLLVTLSSLPHEHCRMKSGAGRSSPMGIGDSSRAGCWGSAIGAGSIPRANASNLNSWPQVYSAPLN